MEKRLEDARARRQIVLEQKDRAARAAKAVAHRTPEPAQSPTKSGDTQGIPRARPEGTNARALEAALRKRDISSQPVIIPTDDSTIRANENEAPDISNDRAEDVPITFEVSTHAYSDPPKQRGFLSGTRIMLLVLAVFAGFGIGIFAAPSLVSGIRGPATLPLTTFALQSAPRQPAVAQIGEGQNPTLAVSFSDSGLAASRRGPPLPPVLIAFQPAPPLNSSPAVGSVQASNDPSAPLQTDTGISLQIAGTRPVPRTERRAIPALQDESPLLVAATNGPNAPLVVRRSVDEASNIQIAALPTTRDDAIIPGASTLTDVVVDDVPVALLSPGPRLVSTSGTQTLALLGNPDELPLLPLLSSAPNPPGSGPASLSPLTGDVGVPAAIAAPPTVEAPSLRLTGIGDLGTYLVHLQSSRSLGDVQLANVESIIAETGLPAGKSNRVSYKISSSQVRFYHRRDAVAAAALAERMGARSRDFTSFRPSPPVGTLEVFLSGAANSRRAAASSGTQTSQQTRELIELRDRIIQSLRNGDHL